MRPVTSPTSEARRSPGLFGKAIRLAVRHPFDTLALIVATAATVAILVNALQLQKGRHPAPLMAPAPAFSTSENTGSLVAVPRARPAMETQVVLPRDAAPVKRSRSQIITDMQGELLRRGFYDGTVDGLYGPRMDLAIREFERLSGVRPTGEPTEELAQALAQSSLRAKTKAAANDKNAAVSGARKADGAAPSSRIVAVQRALSDYGFGQVKPTGVIDGATKTAIEKFERSRKLPINGQLSSGVVREIAAVTGRPLE